MKYIEEIIKIIFSYPYYSPFKLAFKTKSRKREVIEAQNIIIYFVHKYLKFSLIDIGKLIRNQTHANVLHNLKQFENLYATDRSFKERVDVLEIKILEFYQQYCQIFKHLDEIYGNKITYSRLEIINELQNIIHE